MNSPCVDIATYLAGISALGLTVATDLHSFAMPDSPNRCVVVLDGPGEDADENDYERPHIQVVVREEAGKNEEGYALAKDIWDELHSVVEETIGGTRYMAIWTVGDVFPLGEDGKSRPQFSVNARIHRTP